MTLLRHITYHVLCSLPRLTGHRRDLSRESYKGENKEEEEEVDFGSEEVRKMKGFGNDDGGGEFYKWKKIKCLIYKGILEEGMRE